MRNRMRFFKGRQKFNGKERLVTISHKENHDTSFSFPYSRDVCTATAHAETGNGLFRT